MSCGEKWCMDCWMEERYLKTHHESRRLYDSKGELMGVEFICSNPTAVGKI